jgi:hypothetical protein
VGKVAGDLDDQLSEVGKGFVAESSQEGRRSSSPPAGSTAAVAPVTTAVPSVAATAAVAGEERGEDVFVSFRSASLGLLSTGLGSTF